MHFLNPFNVTYDGLKAMRVDNVPDFLSSLKEFMDSYERKDTGAFFKNRNFPFFEGLSKEATDYTADTFVYTFIKNLLIPAVSKDDAEVVGYLADAGVPLNSEKYSFPPIVDIARMKEAHGVIGFLEKRGAEGKYSVATSIPSQIVPPQRVLEEIKERKERLFPSGTKHPELPQPQVRAAISKTAISKQDLFNEFRTSYDKIITLSDTETLGLFSTIEDFLRAYVRGEGAMYFADTEKSPLDSSLTEKAYTAKYNLIQNVLLPAVKKNDDEMVKELIDMGFAKLSFKWAWVVNAAVESDADKTFRVLIKSKLCDPEEVREIVSYAGSERMREVFKEATGVEALGREGKAENSGLKESVRKPGDKIKL